VTGKAYSSLEERSTTGIPSEGPPCSYTGDSDLWDETSGGKPGGGGDPDGEGSGVEALLGEEEGPLAVERECLVPLLSSVVNQ
jgi:hypothetical protein